MIRKGLLGLGYLKAYFRSILIISNKNLIWSNNIVKNDVHVEGSPTIDISSVDVNICWRGKWVRNV